MRFLSILVLSIYMASPALSQSYGDIIMARKYKEAIHAGCHDIKKKNPTTAIALGLLPGGGSFYTGEIGLGVADVLLWPFSPIWDMPLAGKKAKEINQSETVFACEAEGKI